jgi:hypothetical protein
MTITLPIVCSLTFFMLEIIKINDVQIYVDSIAIEMVFNFMASRSTQNFDNIISKHKPAYIPQNQIKWYITIYEDLSMMNGAAPYGGEEIYWPINTGSPPPTNEPTYIRYYSNVETFQADSKVKRRIGPSSNAGDIAALPSGSPFVLTVVCHYNFSSSFVMKLFKGGANTVDKTLFILWGRSVGVMS